MECIHVSITAFSLEDHQAVRCQTKNFALQYQAHDLARQSSANCGDLPLLGIEKRIAPRARCVGWTSRWVLGVSRGGPSVGFWDEGGGLGVGFIDPRGGPGVGFFRPVRNTWQRKSLHGNAINTEWAAGPFRAKFLYETKTSKSQRPICWDLSEWGESKRRRGYDNLNRLRISPSD